MIPTISTGNDATSGASPMRLIASNSTQPATRKSSAAFASAARISRRYNPNVRCGWESDDDAAWIAASAMPSPSASVAMCPASESNASDPVAMPTMTCTTRNVTMRRNEMNSGRMCRAPARIAAAPWLCA